MNHYASATPVLPASRTQTARLLLAHGMLPAHRLETGLQPVAPFQRDYFSALAVAAPFDPQVGAAFTPGRISRQPRLAQDVELASARMRT